MKKPLWLHYPTKTQLIIVITVWAIGMINLIAGITDMFTKNFIKASGVNIQLLMLVSTLVMIRMLVNYLKTRKQ